jgi:lysophospholipase L1-like esterase
MTAAVALSGSCAATTKAKTAEPNAAEPNAAGPNTAGPNTAGPKTTRPTNAVRVMPLGDSITDGYNVPGGYRVGLWRSLESDGYRVDFVGSRSTGPASLGDHDHEGHSGWRIDQIDARAVGWLRATTPRTVLLLLGTNDVTEDYDLPNAPARLSGLIDDITATVPGVELFVSSIVTLADPLLAARVETFNATIPGIAQAKAAQGHHVHFIDMHSALSTSDLADGVHPNTNGYAKMAARWYAALTCVPAALTPDGSSPGPGTQSPGPGTQSPGPGTQSAGCGATRAGPYVGTAEVYPTVHR